MDRPSTSKARGICKYYQTPRGCFAGDQCKFLHREPQADGSKRVAIELTPYDQSKTCRYFARGFCKHGNRCWFRHVIPPQSKEHAVEVDPIDEACSICFEKPALYGLLAGCSHVFCIACLKEWRDPKRKSVDVVQSGVHKKCPMCRAPSKFITPSSIFYKHGDPRKEQTISAYKQSMARVPCRYFVKSKSGFGLFCPFGKDCFYQHLNDDGTPYIFTEGVDALMQSAYQDRERRTIDVTDDLLSDIFARVTDGTIQSPFDVLGRFLDESHSVQFAASFAELFQGLIHQTSDRQGPNPAGVMIPHDPPIVSWPLDGSPNAAGGVQVTLNVMRDDDTGDMPPLEPINAPRQFPGHTSSSSRPVSDNHSTEDNNSEADDSTPSLHEVSDIDDSDQAWSEGNSEIDFDFEHALEHHPSLHFAPALRVLSTFDLGTSSSPPRSVQEDHDHFPRTFSFHRRGSQTHQERIVEIGAGNVFYAAPFTSTSAPRPESNELVDLPPVESLSDSEDGEVDSQALEDNENTRNTHEDERHSNTHFKVEFDSDDMPPLERIDTPSKLRGSNGNTVPPPSLEAFTPAAGDTPTPPESMDGDHDAPPMAPFTTDGRGRVIAASNEGNSGPRDDRSFLSRMIDVLL